MKYTSHDVITWAKKACDAIMATYTPSTLPPAGEWHYHQGVFLLGMIRLWAKTGDEKYYNYTKEYVDHCVDGFGEVSYSEGELDAIQAGNLLFYLYDKTGEERYKKPLDTFVRLLDNWKTTKEGGFWHKMKYPYQMWLDGIYMEGPLACHYARQFNAPKYYDIVTNQAILMEKNTRDKKTGLLYHAWDESRETPWSDKKTGQAPEFWGRALGWYTVAMLNILDYLPENHKDRGRLVEIFQRLMQALVGFQDKETGLWYQVLDKGRLPDNWLETSCSSLFVYSYAKGIRKGFTEQGYEEIVLKGFQGMLSKTAFNDEGLLEIRDICIGTGIGDYAHYVNRPRKVNDLHGVGAFVLACLEMAELAVNS